MMRQLLCKRCGRAHRLPVIDVGLTYQDVTCDDDRIPINVISGFLGAGKTTLMNHILSHPTRERVDVLIREFGKEAVDDQLVKFVSGNTHVFPGISMHDDPQLLLHDYLHDLACNEETEPFDRLLLETSGLDRPESIVQMFMIGYIPQHYRLGSCIVVVDAQYGLLSLEEYEVARHQVAYADAIVINKMDLAEQEEVELLEKTLRKINPMAKIHQCSFGQVDLRSVLNIELYGQLKELEQNEGATSVYGIQTVVLSENKPLDKDKVNHWINELFENTGAKILRGKGFLYFEGEDWRYEFQSVRKSFHSKADRCWEEGEARKSTIVLIGENLPDEKELRASFAACAAV